MTKDTYEAQYAKRIRQLSNRNMAEKLLKPATYPFEHL